VIRRLSIAALLVFSVVLTAASAEAQYGRRSYSYSRGYNPSTVRSNYPGWQNYYPGSSRKYGNLKYYERADRRPLGLFP
jgi:hypothetical protein